MRITVELDPAIESRLVGLLSNHGNEMRATAAAAEKIRQQLEAAAVEGRRAGISSERIAEASGLATETIRRHNRQGKYAGYAREGEAPRGEVGVVEISERAEAGLLTRLGTLGRKYRLAFERADKAREQLEASVVEARKMGLSLRQIGESAGISYETVRKYNREGPYASGSYPPKQRKRVVAA